MDLAILMRLDEQAELERLIGAPSPPLGLYGAAADSLRLLMADNARLLATLAAVEAEVARLRSDAARARADGRVWTESPPAEQGWYWHWNGDADCAPFPLSVLYSGTTGKCFVSMGQAGLTFPIECDQYGGYWMPLERELSTSPPAPQPPPAATGREGHNDG